MPRGLPGRRRLNKTLGYLITGDTIGHRLTRHDVGERTERDAAIKRVGHHRRVIRAVVEKVMGDLRPAGAVRIELLRAAVHQVGRPDQRLPLLRMEVIWLRIMCFYQVAPHRLVNGLRLRPFQLRNALADVFVRIDRPAMAAGEVHQWSVGRIDIFHGDPHTAHESLGAGAEVNRVGVKVLLGTDREIQRLERPGLAAVELRQQGQHLVVAGDALDVVVELPGVLHAQADASLVAVVTPALEIVMSVKLLFDRLGHRIEILIGEVEYCVAFCGQFEGYATGFWIDGFVENAREQRMFNTGNTGERVSKMRRHEYLIYIGLK